MTEVAPKNFALVTSLEELKILCDKLLADGLTVGFDVETGYLGPDHVKGSLSIDWDNQFVCGFSITNSTSWARYVPVAHDYANNLPEYEAWEMLKPVLETLPIVAHNCFTGDTKFVVRDQGAQSLEELAGSVQEVWNGSSWVKAEVRSYGEAPVREVVLAPANRSRSKVRHVFQATSNHRWELRSGEVVTTDQLGLLPKSEVVAMSRYVSEVDEASEAFVHGLIFADGSLCSKQAKTTKTFRHQIRLCGWKSQYKDLFQSHTFPPSSEGDPVCLHTSGTNMKALPEEPDDSYVASFIEGWQLLDGTSRKNHRVLNTVDAEAAEWLVQNAWRAGWLVTGHTAHTSTSTFGTATPHFVQLSRDPAMGWRIVSVSEESEPVEVFCAEVAEGPERFTLAGGVLTGNCKFEIRNLRALKRKGRGPRIDINAVSDSQIEGYVLGEFPKSGLKAMVKKVFKYDQPILKDLFPDASDKRMTVVRFNTLDLSADVVRYACEDAVWTLALHQLHFDRCLRERSFIFDLERRILPLLCDMEDAGHAVDWLMLKTAEAYGQPFEDAMTISARKALTAMNEDPEADYSSLNLRSSKQVAKALYEDLGMSTTRKTKSGALSTDAIALEALSREHVAVKKMLEVREVGNLKARLRKWSTDYSVMWDGRCHANFNQTVVPAGRFSANDPSIQQLPKEWRWTVFPKVDPWSDDHWAQVTEKAEFGKHYWQGNFRNFLIADTDSYLLSFDFSQQELRALAGLSQEPALLEAYANDMDVHVVTAAMMLGVTVEAVTKKMRAIGKTMNFALLYGMGVKALGERLAISYEEAERLYQQYFSAFTRVTGWMKEKKDFGTRHGYVETHFGRKVPLWDLYSSNKAVRGRGERLCVNAPVQGSAADVTKISMLRAQAALVERGWWMTDVRLINNLHDALTFEANNSIDPEELRLLLLPCVSLEIPDFPKFKVDWELGQRWGSSDAWGGEQAAFGKHWTVIYGEAEEDEDDSPEPDLSFMPPAAVTPTLVLEFPVMPERERFGHFINMLQQHPGPNKVLLVTPQGSKELGVTTSLTDKNGTTLRLVLGEVAVSMSGLSLAS